MSGGESEPGSEVVEVADSGAEFIEHPSGIVTVSVYRGDGATQALASFPDATSSEEVVFEINGELSVTEDDLIEVVEPDGNTYTIIEPWAKDANGVDVPTRYELRDGDLIQVVDHQKGDYTYPVVADPWMGITLFHKWTSNKKWKGKPIYTAWVTRKGSLVLGGGNFGVASYAAGQAIFRKNGWAEWKKRFGSKTMTQKATLKQQYDCHVAAGNYGLKFTEDYGLELARINKPNWGSSVAIHLCNWVK